MHESISVRVVGRMAGFLFAASGSIGMVEFLLPGLDVRSAPTQMAVNLGAVVVGIVCWVLPWHAWPRTRTLLLVPLALAMLSLSAFAGDYDPYTFGSYLMLVFVWIGFSHARWTAVQFIPLAVAAYLFPAVTRDGSAEAVTAVVEIAVLSGLVGETLSWMSTHLRKAEALDERRLWEVQTLLRSGEMLASQSDGLRAPDVAADLATQLLRANGALVFLPEDGETLVASGDARWSSSVKGSRVTSREAQVLFDVLGSNRPSVLDQDGLPERVITGHRDGILLAVPMRGAASVQGVMVTDLSRASGHPDRFDEHLAMTFGTQAGLMLERLHVLEALESDSLRDELTGLGNRRKANRVLTSIRPGDAVVLLDLDRLKELNDTMGHAAGDAALCEAASVLAASMREGDHAIRWGGDEFMLVLRDVGKRASEILDRIRDTWAVRLPELGFSAGVAVHGQGDLPAETLARSDLALYGAKGGGRNRTQLDGPRLRPAAAS